MDQITFPFMRLPTELQFGIVNHVGRNSDLKSLCLVSKHVSDIATRRLYYEIKIIDPEMEDINIKKKIKSLLINPANLQFVRVIKTDRMNKRVSMLMDPLLAHLQKDSLKEITFTPYDLEDFPMPYQIEFLWHNQKNIRNLKLMTYMVPWLDKFSKEEGQSAILKFFTNLELNGDYDPINHPEMRNYITQNNMPWPLQNLDLSVLQELTFSSEFVEPFIMSQLNDLFAAGRFVNLTALCFRNICNLSETLTLTCMPSLKVLEMYYLDFLGPDLPLVLAADIRLKVLRCSTNRELNKFIPLLTQAKGLEDLYWNCAICSLAADGIGDFIRAIMAHKVTLRELCLYGGYYVPLDKYDLETTLWDSVRSIMSIFEPGSSRWDGC